MNFDDDEKKNHALPFTLDDVEMAERPPVNARYRWEIIDATIENARQSDYRFLQLTCKVADGEHTGKRIAARYPLTTNGLELLQPLVKAARIREHGRAGNEPLETGDFVGREFLAKLTLEDGKYVALAKPEPVEQQTP